MAFPVIGLIFVIQSSLSLYNLARRGDRVWEQGVRLKELEKEQEELKKQLSESHTDFFIEQEARNKLGLVKPGETLVYLEKEATEAGFQSSAFSSQPSANKTILQQWWEVFF
jgi:cell division protein DivIC